MLSVTTSTSEGNPYRLDVTGILQRSLADPADCDIVLKCADGSFPAHSFWLKRAVPYFAIAAGTGVGAGDGDPFDLSESPVTVAALKLVIDMVYGGTTHITPANAVEVHCAANSIGLEEMADVCVKEISKSISVSNVLDIAQYATGQFTYSHTILQMCQYVVMQNIDSLCECGKFQDLDPKFVLAILQRDSYHEPWFELGLLKALLLWVSSCDTAERSKLLESFLVWINLKDVDFTKLLNSMAYLQFMASNVHPDTKNFVSILIKTPSYSFNAILDLNLPKAVEDCGDVLLIRNFVSKCSKVRSLKLDAHALKFEANTLQSSSFHMVRRDEVLATCLQAGAGILLLWLNNPCKSTHDIVSLSLKATSACMERNDGRISIPNPILEVIRTCGTRALGHGISVTRGRIRLWFVVRNATGNGIAGIHSCDFNPYSEDPADASCTFHGVSPDVSLESDLERMQFDAYGDHIWCSSPTGQPFHLLQTLGIFPPSPSMSKPLFNHLLPGVTVYKDRLYVAGGEEDQKKVEFFDPAKDAWFEVPSLPARGHRAIHLVASKDRLFAIDKFGPYREVYWLNMLEPQQQGWLKGPDVPLDAPISDLTKFFVLSD